MAIVKTGRGYVYSIQYHLVWCVKYRHKILAPLIEKRLIEIINEISEEYGFSIMEVNADLDHIHIMIDCKPQH